MRIPTRPSLPGNGLLSPAFGNELRRAGGEGGRNQFKNSVPAAFS